MKPVGYCVGRDATYPWIFPYIDSDGQPNQSIYMSNTACEKVVDFSVKNDEMNDPPNLGFQIKMMVAAGGAERTSFFGASGTSPNITVEWGQRNPVSNSTSIPNNSASTPEKRDGTAKESETENFIRGFTAHVIPGKQPFLMYHTGQGLVRLFLSDNPVPIDIGEVFLTVEYIGTSMVVKLNDGKEVFIRGYSPAGMKKNGVWVQPNDVRIHVNQCSMEFWFCPIYYNGWDPAITSNFSIGEKEQGVIPSNPIADFLENDNGPGVSQGNGSVAQKFISGQSKILSISNFKLDPGTSDRTSARVQEAIGVMIKNLCDQSPTAKEIFMNTPGWRMFGNTPAATVPFYQQDEGHPPMLRDSRMYGPTEFSTTDVLPIKCWMDNNTYLATWYGANPTNASADTHSAITVNDTQTSMTLMFRSDVTHTTPIIFGFKTHNTDKRYGWESNFTNWIALDDFVEKWTIEWSPSVTTQGGKQAGPGKVMRASASITLLNPTANIISAIAKNQMRLKIENTGYFNNALAVASDNSSLKNILFRTESLFDGLSVSCVLTKESGGQVSLEVSCVDPIKMIESAILETNIRCDGISYLMALSELFRSTDFGDRLVIKMNSSQNEKGPLSPSWAENTGVAGGRSNNLGGSFYDQIFFGYYPMYGKSFEMTYGQPVFQAISSLLEVMSNPRHIPMLFYDPNHNILETGNKETSDNGSSDKFGAYKLTRRNMNSDHPTFYEQGGISDGLPLIASNTGEKAYVLTAQTQSLLSHFVAIGTDRISGSPTKAAAMNPNWNRLGKRTMASGETADSQLNEWASQYGHLGYRYKAIQTEIPPMIPDSDSCRKYAENAMWWLMRPTVKLENLKVHGIVDPIAIEDGCIDIVLGTKDKASAYYKSAMLNSSVIQYDAKTEQVTSTVGVIIMPDDNGGGLGF